MSQATKKLHTIKKAVQKAQRRASAGLFAAAAASAVLPYKAKKRVDPETGDNSYELSSLLLRVSLVPKCEDSLKNRTLLRVGLRPVEEVKEDLRRLEERFGRKDETVVAEPIPLSEKDAKKLAKAEVKAKKLEQKISKMRMKATKRAYKAARKK